MQCTSSVAARGRSDQNPDGRRRVISGVSGTLKATFARIAPPVVRPLPPLVVSLELLVTSVDGGKGHQRPMLLSPYGAVETATTVPCTAGPVLDTVASHDTHHTSSPAVAAADGDDDTHHGLAALAPCNTAPRRTGTPCVSTSTTSTDTWVNSIVAPLGASGNCSRDSATPYSLMYDCCCAAPLLEQAEQTLHADRSHAVAWLSAIELVTSPHVAVNSSTDDDDDDDDEYDDAPDDPLAAGTHAGGASVCHGRSEAGAITSVAARPAAARNPRARHSRSAVPCSSGDAGDASSVVGGAGLSSHRRCTLSPAAMR